MGGLISQKNRRAVSAGKKISETAPTNAFAATNQNTTFVSGDMGLSVSSILSPPVRFAFCLGADWPFCSFC